MDRPRVLHGLALCALSLLALGLAQAAGAASGDTAADRVLGQRRLSTSTPFFVDGRIFGATDVAVDRSVAPNRLYLADADLNRVLGWSDIGRFRAGLSADLVLGQPSVFVGEKIDFFFLTGCPHPPGAASFCRPTRVEVDPAGNLYVADSLNYRVLEFDSPFTKDRTADRVFGQSDFTSRQPVEFGGFGAGGSGDFDFNGVELAVDGAGNLWIADPAGSRRIFGYDAPPAHDTLPDRVIEPRPASQCGTAQQATFCFPVAIGVSPAGDLYVRDSESGPSNGGALWIYRQPLTTDLQPDLTVSFPTPLRDMAFDPAGNLYYFYSFYFYRYPAQLAEGTLPENLRQFHGYLDPSRFAVDSRGNFYVTGTSGQRSVAIFDSPDLTEVPWVGREERTSQGLRRPSAVAVDRSTSPNHLYVVDETLRLFGWRDAAGFANGAPADLVLSCDPGGLCPGNSRVTANVLAVDSRGNLWISDIGGNRVLELDRPFDTDLIPDRILGQGGCDTGGRSASSLCRPGALAFDRDDNLYVADLGNHRVLLFKAPLRDGVADKVFGQADFRQGQCNRGNGSRPGAASLCFGFEDGGFQSTAFAASGGVAVDGQGNLFVADSLNHRVLIFKDASRSDSVADAVLGQDGKFNTISSGTGARRFGGATRDTFPLFGPSGLAIGPAGDLYVADPPNDRLLVFVNPLRNDMADRVFGHASLDDHGVRESAEIGGPPANATRLLRPTALDFDALGNLYVADTFYNRVLAFDRP